MEGGWWRLQKHKRQNQSNIASLGANPRWENGVAHVFYSPVSSANNRQPRRALAFMRFTSSRFQVRQERPLATVAVLFQRQAIISSG